MVLQIKFYLILLFEFDFYLILICIFLNKLLLAFKILFSAESKLFILSFNIFCIIISFSEFVAEFGIYKSEISELEVLGNLKDEAFETQGDIGGGL